MNAAKTILASVICIATMTSVAMACALHEPEVYVEPSITPEIEDAFLSVHGGEGDDHVSGSGTLRVFVNPDQLFADVSGMLVRVTNEEAIDADIVTTMAVPNSGELIVDITNVTDFHVGAWRVEMTAIDVEGNYANEAAQAEVRLVEQPQEMLSSGCDIGSSGSTTWSSLMGFVLLGLMGLGRRRGASV